MNVRFFFIIIFRVD